MKAVAIITSLALLVLAPLVITAASGEPKDWPRTSFCVYPFMNE